MTAIGSSGREPWGASIWHFHVVGGIRFNISSILNEGVPLGVKAWTPVLIKIRLAQKWCNSLIDFTLS